jgi:hypothetical protein
VQHRPIWSLVSLLTFKPVSLLSSTHETIMVVSIKLFCCCNRRPAVASERRLGAAGAPVSDHLTIL